MCMKSLFRGIEEGVFLPAWGYALLARGWFVGPLLAVVLVSERREE